MLGSHQSQQQKQDECDEADTQIVDRPWRCGNCRFNGGPGRCHLAAKERQPVTHHPRPGSGEGGEGGGEGGGAAPTTYALESTDPNAFKYDATPQIDAYIDLVASSYKKAADDAKTLAAAVDALLAALPTTP